MVIPVVEQDRADQRGARHRHHRRAVHLRFPPLHQSFIAELAERRLDGLHAFVVRVEDLLNARRIRHLLAFEFGDAIGCPARDHTRAAGDVERQIAERHRFRVRLPGQLVLRHAFEHAARRFRFCFDFLQDRGSHRHRSSSWAGRGSPNHISGVQYDDDRHGPVDEAVRGAHRRPRRVLRRASRRSARPAGPQRQREEHDGEEPHRTAPSYRRAGDARRRRHLRRPAEVQSADRVRAGGTAPLLVSHRSRVFASRRPLARDRGRRTRREDRPLHAAARHLRRSLSNAVVVFERHAAEDPHLGRGAPQSADRRPRRTVLGARCQRGADSEVVRPRHRRGRQDRHLQFARPRSRRTGLFARRHSQRRTHRRSRLGRESAIDLAASVARRRLREPRPRRERGRTLARPDRGDARVKILFRAFLAQFFTSETVTSDVQMRQAISGLIAFIITPCLVLFPFSRTAGAAKLTALIAYSMITVGLVAVYAWDALTFDRRDAMVLGPLPIRGRTMVTAKLAAVGALLFGTAFAICTLNSILFALQTADRSGWQTFAVSFFSCLIATTAGAVLVFSSIVFLRAVVVMLGGERFAMMIGSLVQLVLAVALLQLLITVFLSGHRHEQLPHIHVNPALALVSLLAAIVVSIATFRQQMRRALTPSSTPGPLGHARLGRWIAAMVCGRDGIARAMSGFVLTTVARNRVHQTPIAMNAAVGIACVVISLARQHTDTLTLTVAAPLMVAYWVAIGLRASFYVPSELPAAWAFVAHAPNAFLQYARGVRAAIFGFIAPLTAVAAFLVSGWTGAGRAVLLIAALADAIVLTIRF